MSADESKRTVTATAIDRDTTLISVDKEALASAVAKANAFMLGHKVSVLRRVRAFSEMPLEKLEELASFFVDKTYRKGHVIYGGEEEGCLLISLDDYSLSLLRLK